MKRSSKKILSILLPIIIIISILAMVFVAYNRNNEKSDTVKKIKDINKKIDKLDPDKGMTEEEVAEVKSELAEDMELEPVIQEGDSAVVISKEDVAERLSEVKPGQENSDVDRDDLLNILNK